MVLWEEFWKQYRVDAEDPLVQVGATVGGMPVTDDQVQLVVTDVREKLALGPDDRLLDLCCGNGFFTHRFGERCAAVLGIDFMAHMVERASKAGSERMRFVRAAVGDPEAGDAIAEFAPTKVVLYNALHYFDRDQLRRCLAQLRRHLGGEVPFLIGAIPDRARLWSYYDTWARKLRWATDRVRGRESGIGRFWRFEEIRDEAERLGMTVAFRPEPDALYMAHYRFDALVRISPTDRP